MPDYSKTTIYKIKCLNPNVRECYIGSTTHIKIRKNQHKFCSKTPTRPEYNYPIYKKIREHGGFENWTVDIIEEIVCQNKAEKIQRERHWYELIQPSLNKQHPGLTRAETNAKYRLKNR